MVLKTYIVVVDRSMLYSENIGFNQVRQSNYLTELITKWLSSLLKMVAATVVLDKLWTCLKETITSNNIFFNSASEEEGRGFQNGLVSLSFSEFVFDEEKHRVGKDACIQINDVYNAQLALGHGTLTQALSL